MSKPLSNNELELVSVVIHRVDYELLNKIAKFEGITIAHALSMQFSGFGLYDHKCNRLKTEDGK